jgi:DNA-binding winged helix-turn-helix (wHTH) protein/Tol biopolymer transport system component
MNPESKQFAFGPFTLDPANRRLLRDEKPAHIGPKAFDILAYLAENNRRLITRDELMKSIWPDSVVEDANLTVNISLLRKVLGSRDNGEPYIETVPRKGYRFNAEVTIIAPAQHGIDLPVTDTTTSELAVPPIIHNGSSFRLAAWILFATAVIIILSLATSWFQSRRTDAFAPVRQRRLTSFAPENAVTAAAISTGAKFIAYANREGLFVQVIASAETHALQLPQPRFRVSSISWFPDSAKILIDGANPGDDGPSLWMVPVIGSARPVKVGSYGPGFVSPDGMRIALRTNRDSIPLILVMDYRTAKPRVLATGSGDEVFGDPAWTLDGRGILFIRYTWNPEGRNNTGAIDFCDLATSRCRTIFSGSDFTGAIAELAGGRIVYSRLLGANPSAYGGELLQLPADSRTRNPAPRVIADWSAPITDLSVSHDGKHLVFRDLIVEHNVYLGDLGNGGKILLEPHAITFGMGREDFPRAWRADSRALFIDSNRNGNWEIFERQLDGTSDTAFITGIDDAFSPRVSPDGKWLLYFERPRDWHEPQPVKLERVPISRGLPEPVLTASNCSQWGLRFECPRGGSVCVLAQREANDIVFRAFSPSQGFIDGGRSFGRHPFGSHPTGWSISPDGSRLAWVSFDAGKALIHLIPLRGGKQTSVSVPGWSHLHAIAWAPSGSGWFAVAQFHTSWSLLYIAPRGDGKQLLKVDSRFAPDVFPSPDGRRLAFSEEGFASNVWLWENFRPGA